MVLAARRDDVATARLKKCILLGWLRYIRVKSAWWPLRKYSMIISFFLEWYGKVRKLLIGFEEI